MKKHPMALVTALILLFSLHEVANAERNHAAPSINLESGDIKRYIGALAKNGRLPTIQRGKKPTEEDYFGSPYTIADAKMALRSMPFSFPEDTIHPESWSDDNTQSKQQSPDYVINATLSREVSPNIVKMFNQIGSSTEDRVLDRLLSDLTSKDSLPTRKRNIAALARKGWLTALRSYRPPPLKNYYPPRDYEYNWKREILPSNGNSEEQNSLEAVSEDEECIDDNENISKVGRLYKRNIAALARAGRLPHWHRRATWWDLKRDNYVVPLHRFWKQTPTSRYSNKRQPIENHATTRRCKKVQYSPQDNQEDNFLTPIHGFQSKDDSKRNIAMLVRKGLLPGK
ncbi:uncharacterized protein LOC143230588 [Tachypleus tridentatus]|uniref:uncharacterized protein LOC143230588 n=1 Tax=Tachypleus tridentatus TaxID=6853 RepID=UPI003FD3EE32